MRKIFYINGFFELDEDFEGDRIEAMKAFAKHYEEKYGDTKPPTKHSNKEEIKIMEESFKIGWDIFENKIDEDKSSSISVLHEQENENSKWITVENNEQ